MPHATTDQLQRMSNNLAKAVRAQPQMTDELYKLLTIFNARIRLLEEQHQERVKEILRAAK